MADTCNKNTSSLLPLCFSSLLNKNYFSDTFKTTNGLKIYWASYITNISYEKKLFPSFFLLISNYLRVYTFQCMHADQNMLFLLTAWYSVLSAHLPFSCIDMPEFVNRRSFVFSSTLWDLSFCFGKVKLYRAVLIPFLISRQ